MFNEERIAGLKSRFMAGSLNGFNGQETIELLLGCIAGGQGDTAVAKELLQRFKGLRGVLDATPEKLMSVDGVCETRMLLIRFIKEAALEYLREKIAIGDVLRRKDDVLDYLTLKLSGERIEKFLAIYLNAKHEVLAVELLHEGTLHQTAVYPRKFIELAFRHNAYSIIFVHNHPSGHSTPSMHDRRLTTRLAWAASAVGLLVHDHLIIGRNDHFSAREHGWLTEDIMQHPMAAEL